MARSGIACLLVASLLLAAPPAAAAQLDASDRPQASGPLTYEGKSCAKHTMRGGGQVVAKTRTCLFLYTFSPLSELDAFRDHGAAWAQTEVDPRNGWCATAIGSSLSLPKETEGHARAPKAKKIATSKRVTTKLVVDAQGSALSDGVLRQGYRLYPKGIAGATSDGGRTYTVTWTGRTSKTLAFALGVEFSAPAGDVLFGDLGPFGAGLVQPLSFARC
ncbi:MAG: hypothetical protein ACRDI0_06845 [Actinomycetota bacterium]